MPLHGGWRSPRVSKLCSGKSYRTEKDGGVRNVVSVLNDVPRDLMVHGQIQAKKTQSLHLCSRGMIQHNSMVEAQFSGTSVVH